MPSFALLCLPIAQVLLACHGVLAVLVLFFAKAEAHPLPRSPVNRNIHTLQAVEAFGFIFGFIVGGIDAAIVASMTTKCYPSRSGSCCVKFIFFILAGAVTLAVAFFFMMSPWIFQSVLSRPAFAHACDADWLTVLLTGHKYKHDQDKNTAVFSLSSAPSDVLFTFTSQDPDASVFGLVNTSAGAAVTPALRNITYDFNAHTVSGLCNGDASGAPCLTGTWDQSSFLAFDLAFNGTRTRLRSAYKDWSFEDVPSVILHRVEPSTGALAERVLQTSVGQCQRLKVCVPRDASAAGTVLGADILVAVGWILNQQAPYAVKCTTPSD